MNYEFYSISNTQDSESLLEQFIINEFFVEHWNYPKFQVAAEVAAPLSQAKKITMVSTGQGDVGAAKLTGEVLDIVTKVPGLVKTMTGVDIVKVCNNRIGH